MTTSDAIDRRVAVRFSERACILSGLAIVTVMMGGFFVAGLLPPPSAAMSPTELAAYYFEHVDRMRVGVTLLSVGGVFILPFGVAMAASLRRIEGPHSITASGMVAATAFISTATCIYLFMMLSLLYRPDREPSQVVLLNDLAWVPFVGMWQPGALQAIFVALAVLGDPDPSRPGHWPRWVGWVSAWYALTSLVGALVPFMITGPFTWSGLITFYLGAAALFGWWIVMAVAMVGSTRTARTVEEMEALSGVRVGDLR